MISLSEVTLTWSSIWANQKASVNFKTALSKNSICRLTKSIIDLQYQNNKIFIIYNCQKYTISNRKKILISSKITLISFTASRQPQLMSGHDGSDCQNKKTRNDLSKFGIQTVNSITHPFHSKILWNWIAHGRYIPDLQSEIQGTGFVHLISPFVAWVELLIWTVQDWKQLSAEPLPFS